MNISLEKVFKRCNVLNNNNTHAVDKKKVVYAFAIEPANKWHSVTSSIRQGINYWPRKDAGDWKMWPWDKSVIHFNV